MEPAPEVLAELDALRDEGVRRGPFHELNFAIAYAPGAMSSEAVLLTVDDRGFVVHHRDMGQNRELARGATVAEVAERFLEEAARLAGPRGRGPYAGQEPPNEFAGMTREQVMEEYRRRGFAI